MSKERTKNFGYEPNYELEKFDPNIYQGYSNTCAIRSQEIVLRDYGIMLSQDELVEFASKNGWFNPDPVNGGTDKYSVGNVLDACGVQTTRTEDATIYDIIAELRAGHRVIVSVDANELWIKNEPNLFKKLFGEVTNKVNDSIQNFLGIEGANHALVVAGVNVNPKDPSGIKVTLIDSGTGEVCIEYSFKEFHNAWEDGHCQMISTNVSAPYQYNYQTHQMEPSGFNSEYAPSMIEMPNGLDNQFTLAQSFYDNFKDVFLAYDDGDCPIEIELGDISSINNDDEKDLEEKPLEDIEEDYLDDGSSYLQDDGESDNNNSSSFSFDEDNNTDEFEISTDEDSFGEDNHEDN